MDQSMTGVPFVSDILLRTWEGSGQDRDPSYNDFPSFKRELWHDRYISITVIFTGLRSDGHSRKKDKTEIMDKNGYYKTG